MSIRLLLAAVPLIAAAATASPGQQASSPSEAARAFTLDALTPTPTSTPTPADAASPAAAPTLAAPVIPDSAPVALPEPATAPPPAVRAVYTLDTPIQDLIADPGARAVLDRDLPGMSDDENLDKFKMLSLRSLQPQTGGQLTDAMLTKVAADLVVLGGGPDVATPAPIRAGNSKRNNDASR